MLCRKRRRRLFHGSLVVLLLSISCGRRLVSCDAAAAVTRKKQPPNIVLLLTDDLDWTLGGANASTLHATRRLIGEQGLALSHWFVQTPVCCPSRAELLTGKFFHNLRTKTASADGCMHVNVQDTPNSTFYQRDYFANYFAALNYTVGVFGKHLNTHNPTNFLPDGVDEMLINGGGDYLNPSFTRANQETQATQVHFNNCTDMPCYSTSVIGNASLAWIQRHLQSETDDLRRPFFALISVKAPHLQDGPGFPVATPAPWYENMIIPEHQAPRTPNYNHACPDHHWLVRSQPPLTKEEACRVDQLYVSRLKTLLSVDDLVQELVETTLGKNQKVLDNTYIVFTSDNGYRLGQFQMPQGKFHPYENDIRVPMMIRGPGIVVPPTGSSSSNSIVVGTHVDMMPTLFGLALGNSSQEVIPETMDGTNLVAGILKNPAQPVVQQRRRSLLIEYMSLGNVTRYQHLEDIYNHTFLALRILDPLAEPGARNLKYVEFRDSRIDWNGTRPPLEMELFDLDQDPYELHNLVKTASPIFLEALGVKVQRLFHCQGQSCRKEQEQTFNHGLLVLVEDND
jgi:N-acetylglucosamine-6-sulfatase